ncbi:ARM repeat-containing protein [Coccomyxa subellipsoidea C-169]|uniref:ARM repeat-containing protein n=1 Tax=Coccomyxa subellipsoidea (strain C-169) TaxID=574566 RepID=I0Z8L3_COCSC|nr:ARM repeat-containing protein [Coccomyxa subellipsoidea C-169]EIE26982.1 ARM repeat-containing protein [Coccomyxa subellipsoidea C-169]|eukprot:XP_005651526.1 ARM repeat-containing protein [Coccomyxa subellipsoidea C-169]
MEAEVQQHPVELGNVFAAITGAFSLDAPVRNASEASLKEWEADASIRLLAAVVAKNSVGSSWRKTLGTREWSRVPSDEKAGVRTSALHLLFSETSDRVATQLGLLITNIARFDFPSEWGTLLADLTQAAAWETGATTFRGKERALFTLKNVIRALRGKRIVVEAPRSNGSMSPQDLKPLADRIAAERAAMNERARATFPPVAAEWRAHFAAAAQGANGWAERGRLANRGLHVLRELLLLLPDWDPLLPDIGQFLEALHQGSSATVTMLVPGNGAGAAAAAERERVGTAAKSFERALQCVLAALDKQPVGFARFLPAFLAFYGHAALVALDAAALQHVRPKTRVLLTRFLARVLLCPYYTSSWLEGRTAREAEQEDPEKGRETKESLEKAVAAVDKMLSAEQCAALVEAVVTKYVALTPEELQEWQDNPEGYVRSTDVESSPDADTPRPCGLALLICMLKRGPDTVAAALVSLAAKLQAGPLSAETVLAREAVYRAIGEGFFRPAVAAQVNFPAWYSSELADLLQNGSGQAAGAGRLQRSVLVARAAWLVGVCGGELPPALWSSALSSLTSHIADADVVLGLTATSAAMSLCTALLEQQHAIRQAQERKKNTNDARLGLIFLSKRNAAAEDPSAVQDHEARTAALTSGATALFSALFGLLNRLEEAESKVRVLQLVSVAVEVLGDSAQPHLGAVASALPQVWSATQEATQSETGALSRLHSALIAVVTHVVTRLGSRALRDPQFGGVLWPLLGTALDVGSAESETLVEEGLRLLTATLGSVAELPPPLLALLPALFAVLQRGRDNAAVYSALESFALLGGAQLFLPYERTLFACLHRSMAALEAELAAASEPPQPPKPGQRGGLLSREAMGEALAGSSLITVLVQLLGDAALQPLEPSLRAMAAAVCAPIMAAEDVPQPLVTIAEGLLEVLGRVLLPRPAALPPLLPGNDPEAAGRFFDAWLSAALTRYLEEILGVPAMAAMGRLRRRSAAAAFCAFVCAGVSPALSDDPGRLARVFALSLRSIEEENLFQEDREDIRRSIAEMQASRSERDALLLRRAVLAEASPVLTIDLPAALRAAFAAAAQRQPEAKLVEAVGWIDGSLEASLRMVIGQNRQIQRQ